MPNFYMDVQRWIIPGCIELDFDKQWEANYLCIAINILCFTIEWDITLWTKSKDGEE